MAARQNRKNSRNSNAGIPQWMVFSAGILFGLALSFLIDDVFLSDKKDEKTADVSNQAQTKQSDDGKNESMPRFEFYSILPELEVVIPDEFTDTLKDVLPDIEQTATESAQENDAAEAPPASGETYFIQAGSFNKKEDAERMKVKLLLLGLDVDTKAVTVEGKQYHRVRIGPLVDYGAFETARDRLKENNIQYIVLKSRAP
ncbi:MAG: SPOR domain-containing protein [Pseudomonadota bacterium]